MKFIILFLISLSVFANYIPKSKIGDNTNGLRIFTSATSCQNHYSEPCIKIPSGYNSSYHELVAETQMKEDVESCDDEADCEAKHAAKECSTAQATPIMNLDLMESYCTWTRPEQVMVNAGKKSTYDTEKAAADALGAALAQAKANMECGKDVQALLVVRNAAKELTTAQVKTVVETYSTIKQLLDSGSLNTAKEEIQAVTADGTLVTEADKTALVAKIDECLGL